MDYCSLLQMGLNYLLIVIQQKIIMIKAKLRCCYKYCPISVIYLRATAGEIFHHFLYAIFYFWCL
jgi:hypothetical protein